MKQKKFVDYLDPLMPLSIQFIYAANLFAILKIAGELEKLDWTFILIMGSVGTALRLVKAAVKQATDQGTTAEPSRQTNA